MAIGAAAGAALSSAGVQNLLPCSASLWSVLTAATRELRNESAVASKPCWRGPFSFCGVPVPPEEVVFSTSRSFAMLAPRPVLPGHAVVTPRRNVKAVFDLSKEEVDDLFQAVQAVQYVLNGVTMTDSCTMLLQQGEAAEQRLPQLYVHLVPRREGDLASNDDIYPLLETSIPLPLHEPGISNGARDGLNASDIRYWLLRVAADERPATTPSTDAAA
ncbi:histidine triad domain-containing protein [Besnoitia besnoiti]|uniref:Histidine triad domain-containing protein n=1 Tax=Besnoitia besnoiti TaxID=94643 RepID=A0A2A9MHZ9_BESBE|nr:histidine triad domain-containing protein [Besnoitia besnoiti]PFH35217.1 histidine triad domain-containing protein [Besnoitia besnoiti]